MCYGSSVVDYCGLFLCKTTDQDCNGVCFGEAVEDCAGVCGGLAVVDDCGVCNGNGFCNPVIYEIIDVPQDQGGRVYVSFYASSADIDTLRSEMYMVERLDNQNWNCVFTGVAYGHESYVYEVPTLVNDTDNQDGTTSFRVIASMDEGNWASNVFEGFSTDDLAPSIPSNFMAEILDEYNVQLIWDNVPENDLVLLSF